MVRFGAFAVAATLSLGALGSWYWPFGSDDEEVIPRVSELMEPASTNIDAATDFEYDGKFDEAIACYEAALRALDMVEAEYPDQMDKPEFTTVKTKRAYVKTKIDTLKFLQVKENSKAVAVSDTTELEKKLAEEKAAAAKAATPATEPAAEEPTPAPAAEVPASAPAPASSPGRKTARVDCTVYYLPNQETYCRKAWLLNSSASAYSWKQNSPESRNSWMQNSRKLNLIWKLNRAESQKNWKKREELLRKLLKLNRLV